MPTAVDVLDRIKAERRAKFAEETKPMREYIEQMQAMKAEQRHRTEAKEDYVWQAEQTTQRAEERRVAESKRLGDVATKYYAGTDFRDLLSKGDASLEDLDKIRTMGASDTFKKAQGELKSIKGTNATDIASQLKLRNPDIDNESLNLLTEAKRQQNYDNAYKRVIGTEDKLKEAENVYIDGLIDYSQYSQMVSDINSQNKSQADFDLTNAKADAERVKMIEEMMRPTFAQVADSEEFKKAVAGGSYSEKLRAGRKVLEDWKGGALDNNETKSLFSRAVGKEPTDRQIDIANDPVNFAKNFINTDDKEFTVADRQNYTRELAEAQAIFDGDTPYSKGSILAPQYMEDIDKAIKKKPKIAERWNIDPEKSFAEQYIDLNMFNGLINELGLEFKGDMGIIELTGEDKEEALRNKTINPRIANQNATPEESNYVNEMNRIARGGK